MEPEEIEDYVAEVLAEVMPVLRAAVNMWERLGVTAPPPEELVESLLAQTFGWGKDDDGQ